MAEPTTAITDFLLAAVAIVLAWRCVRDSVSRKMWGMAFFFTGIAALAGGIYHSTPSALVWKVTTFSVGVATFFLIDAAARATISRRSAQILEVVAGIQLAAYLVWMATHDEFTYVIADYGSGMLCVAILYAIALPRIPVAAKFVLASIAVAAIGAYVQAAGITLHRNFNHNDLYHVIQMVSLLLLYRGARTSDISFSTAAVSA